MKDKSKFISSVLVSLLAGIIYYFLSGNNAEIIATSVKAVLINDNQILYGPELRESFTSINMKTSGIKKKNNKKLFVKSKSGKLTDLNNQVVLLSDAKMLNAPAKQMKPIADRNLNFKSGLEFLSEKSKKFKSLSELDEDLIENRQRNEFADNYNSSKIKMHIKKDLNNKGKGFEYNYMMIVTKSKKTEKSGNGELQLKMDLRKSDYDIKTSKKDIKKNKIILKSGKNNKCNKEKNEIIIPDGVLDDDTL